MCGGFYIGDDFVDRRVVRHNLALVEFINILLPCGLLVGKQLFSDLNMPLGEFIFLSIIENIETIVALNYGAVTDFSC